MAATANAREVIGEATLGELESTLRGRLIRPSDPDYDQARLVWNAAHDRRPVGLGPRAVEHEELVTCQRQSTGTYSRRRLHIFGG